MRWVRLVYQVGQSQLDDLEAQLWDQGAVSVTVTDPHDNPIYEPPPGETPLWQEVNVAGLFEEDCDVQQVVAEMDNAGFPLLYSDDLADRLWEREWMTEFQPMQFGDRLWVCPTGFEVPVPDAVIMRLDPGLAFGTGTHATTHLCLEWIDANVQPGMRVLDFGCGSGILGIACLLLGASIVVGVDNDPQALTATTENAERNGVADRFSVTDSYAEDDSGFDIVLANILAKPLIDLAPVLSDAVKPEGHLVLSGILASQRQWVEDAYLDRLRLVGGDEREGWVCLHGRR